MQESIDNIKTNWLMLARFGVFFSGIIAIIISPPPIANFNNNTIKILITLIIAFLLIPIFLYKDKRYFRYWLFTSLITFLISVSLVICYNYFSSKYIITYTNKQVVIGSKFLPTTLKKINTLNKEENETYGDGSEIHNFDLLSFGAGNAERIWDFKSINQNKILIVTLFYFSIFFTTILFLCIIQTLQILYSEH